MLVDICLLGSILVLKSGIFHIKLYLVGLLDDVVAIVFSENRFIVRLDFFFYFLVN